MAKQSEQTSSSDSAKKPAAKFLRRLIYGLSLLAVWGVIAVALLVFYYALSLPPTERLDRVGTGTELSVYSTHDRLIARRGRKGGLAVRYGDLPPVLVQAVTAIEDRRFFSHFGVDPRGLARAALANLRAGRTVQGGSTLTQQLAKNVFLTPERSFKRKVQELLLAFWLEAQFSKQDLMALYLNRVYFGAGAYGVQAAAQTYFNRPVQSLTAGEAAMLAGLLKAPSRYAPTVNPEAAQSRARLVIAAMRDAGHLSDDAAQELAASDVLIVARSSDAAHYAVDWALDQLPDYVGRPRADLDIVTTLDGRLQLAAEQAVREVMRDAGAAKNAGQAAMVVMTPDGAIRALVGGRSYADSPYNRAAQARRQPGSAFKPLVYLAALEKGLKPQDRFDDAPVSVGKWQPKNYDEKYRGTVTAREALKLSLNTVAVKISEQTGRDKVIDVARRLGISARLRPHPSLALGAFEMSLLELTTAYAHFANGGRQSLPHIISAVVTGSGELLYERSQPLPLQPFAPAHIGTLNDMLRDGLTSGTGRRAAIDGLDLAGKTGTSQNWRDAWFIGYSGALVVGVWVGNDDNSPMDKVTGGGLPAQIWRHFMVGQKQLSDEIALPGGALAKDDKDAGGFIRRLFGL